MIFVRLFWAFFKIGALGFSGGLVIVSMIYESIQDFITISENQFAEIVAIAQVTPGPIAINTATYVGFESAGIPGSLVATCGVAVPAFIIISVVASTVDKYRESSIVQGALAGIRPATFGMIVMAGITLGKPTFFGDEILGAAGRIGGTISSALGLDGSGALGGILGGNALGRLDGSGALGGIFGGNALGGLTGSGILGIDIASILICVATVVLIKKCNIGSFKVLIAMAVVGALISI